MKRLSSLVFVIVFFLSGVFLQDAGTAQDNVSHNPSPAPKAVSSLQVKLSGSETDTDAPIAAVPISGELGELRSLPRGHFFIHVLPGNNPVMVHLATEQIDYNENGRSGSIRLDGTKFFVSGTKKVLFKPLTRSDERGDIRIVAHLEGENEICASNTVTVFEFVPSIKHSQIDLRPSDNLVRFAGDLSKIYPEVMIAGGKNKGIKAFGVKDQWILPDLKSIDKGGVTAAASYLRRGTMAVVAQTPREDYLVASGKSPDEISELKTFLEPIASSARLVGSTLTIDTVPGDVFEGTVNASFCLSQKVEGSLRAYADTTGIPKHSDTETARHTVNVASTATSSAAKVLSVGGMVLGPAVAVTSMSLKAAMGGDVYSRAEAEAYVSVKGLRDGELRDFSTPIILGKVHDTPSRLHTSVEVSPRTLGGVDVPLVKVPGLETEEKIESIDWTLRFKVGADSLEEAVVAHVGSSPTKFLVYSGLHVSVVRGNNECEADASLKTEPIETSLVVYEWK